MARPKRGARSERLAEAVLKNLEFVSMLGDDIEADVEIERLVDGRSNTGEKGTCGRDPRKIGLLS